MKNTAPNLQLLLLAVSFSLFTGCGGATDKDPTQITYDDADCPEISGWLYSNKGVGSEQGYAIQFLGPGQIFASGSNITSGGGWFLASCSGGIYEVSIGREPYLIWSEDNFNSIKFAPADDKQSALTYEFEAAY